MIKMTWESNNMRMKLFLAVLPVLFILFACGEVSKDDENCDLDDFCRFLLDKCPDDWNGWVGTHGTVAACVNNYRSYLGADPNCLVRSFTECVCSISENATTCTKDTADTIALCREGACDN